MPISLTPINAIAYLNIYMYLIASPGSIRHVFQAIVVLVYKSCVSGFVIDLFCPLVVNF